MKRLSLSLISLCAFAYALQANLHAAPPTTSLSATRENAALPDWNQVALVGRTDRNPVAYRADEPIVFTLEAERGGQILPKGHTVLWTITGDDGQTRKGETPLDSLPLTLTASIDRPGFVRLNAVLTDMKGNPQTHKYLEWGVSKERIIAFDGGAGADVEKTAQAVPEPADFDAFWTRQKARLAAVPLKHTAQKIETRDGIDIFAVSVDCAGPRPVTGYLAIPAGAADKSLPARVVYMWYGVEKQQPPRGNPREIVLSVNAHGFDLGKPDAYYKDFAASIQSNGKPYALDPIQNNDPETAYFNAMALRVMRALEFAKSLPQWNGKNLTASGISQGGLQAVWAAALDPDVSACETGVTWCCNLAGATRDARLPGWAPAWTDALGYYDAVNHARRVRCPVYVERAGLGDYTCPPSGLSVLYNNLGGPKKIKWVQGSTHGYVPKPAQSFEMQSPPKSLSSTLGRPLTCGAFCGI